MELVLGALFLAWLISAAVKNGKLDHEYAKQGLVSPRLSAKYADDAEGRARVAKYGLLDHIRDAWRDGWARRTDALIAARDAKATRVKGEGFKARWRRRRRAALAVAAPEALTTETDEPDPDQAYDRVLTDTAPEPAPAEPVPTTEAGDTWGLLDGRDRPDDENPAPAPGEPATDTPPTPIDSGTAPTGGDPDAAQPIPAADTAPTGGAPMSTTTGEVVNFETAITEIDRMIAETQQQIDSATAALAALAETKARVDEMQQTYVGDAAANKLDHEAALNLDGTTLTHAGTTVDALPVGAVDSLYTEVEQVETLTRQRLEQAELALAALLAERAHLIATYADAHDVVASNLGGDSRFLASDGGGATGGATTGPAAPATAPEPEPANA